jgi:EAL domain-containing protein (putative c-di-GMP-specific phosphodiesterase class I)
LAPTGVGIVLDGAGGGPATFRRLAELPPVSTVKLDPALVGVDRTGQVDVGVLASAARRAADNELLAVATGVESTDQLELVRRAGLEQVQGFLLQRPSVARHVMPLLVTGCPIP